MTLLSVTDLRVHFRSNGLLVRANEDVSLGLEEGEVLGIIGETGSGKSILGRAIVRLLPPSAEVSGSIRYKGKEILSLPPREMVGLRGSEMAIVLQNPATALDPTMSVGEQVAEVYRYREGKNRRASLEMASEMLARIGIDTSRKDEYPHQFSGGMRQRAMIAMALSCNPQLLIADEPTTFLDVTIQAQIIDIVKRLRDELGMTVIWITHDLGIIAGIADRVIVMYAGYLVEEASVKELYSDPRHPYTLGLLGSVPRLDEARKERLTSIDGLPPDQIDMPPGCPFAPRCVYAIDRCLEENPSFRAVAPYHKTACWVDVKSEQVNKSAS